MARTLEFDYVEVLERAMHLFWRKGYVHTSLRDLLRAMQIGEGSFYNTFKNKKNTYLECLKRYNATFGKERAEAFAKAPTAALAVRVLFGVVLDCLSDPNTPSPICLMAGTMSAEVLNDPELRAYVEGELSELTHHLTARMAADKAQGLLSPRLEPQIVVPIIMTYLQGMWRMAMVATEDRAKLEQQIEAFLAGLQL